MYTGYVPYSLLRIMSCRAGCRSFVDIYCAIIANQDEAHLSVSHLVYLLNIYMKVKLTL